MPSRQFSEVLKYHLLLETLGAESHVGGAVPTAFILLVDLATWWAQPALLN